MSTLYRILGLADNATAEQVEQAYQASIRKLDGQALSAEEILIQRKSIAEAYSVLSSPLRRQAYDAKLANASSMPYLMEAPSTQPWKWIGAGALVLFCVAGIALKSQHDARVRAAQMAEVARAKAQAEAEAAEAQAKIENAQLEKAKVVQQLTADLIRKREEQQARMEGKRIHYELERAREMQEREIRAQAQEKERQERRAAMERSQEEQAAKWRAYNETAAMQRALAIPISRH